MIDPSTLAIGRWYRHRKTGGTYQLILFATIEATMQEAVVYSARHDGELRWWVRPLAEFCDGRFEPVDMSKYVTDR